MQCTLSEPKKLFRVVADFFKPAVHKHTANYVIKNERKKMQSVGGFHFFVNIESVWNIFFKYDKAGGGQSINNQLQFSSLTSFSLTTARCWSLLQCAFILIKCNSIISFVETLMSFISMGLLLSSSTTNTLVSEYTMSKWKRKKHFYRLQFLLPLHLYVIDAAASYFVKKKIHTRTI